MCEFSLLCSNQQATETLGRLLAGVAKAGDSFLLTGPVGAGKSVFARAFIKKYMEPFESDIDVPSPTYTLVQTYMAGHTEIWHTDLYRLRSLEEIDELGLLDAFGTAICIVEWADMLHSIKPSGATELMIKPSTNLHDERRIHIRPGNKDIRKAVIESGAEDAV